MNIFSCYALTNPGYWRHYVNKDMRKALTVFLLIISSNNSFAGETFKYIGSFDNIKATETGHCYGEGVSLVELKDKKIIGLFHVARGLCGDPACSVIKGDIRGEQLSFKTLVPIYNESYAFEGAATEFALSGFLNSNDIELKMASWGRHHNNISEWCASWLKISRCKGVTNVCN